MYVNVNVKVPQEILLTLRESTDEFIVEMKRNIAVKYYKEKKLSIGQCAELAEMKEEGFIKYLSEQKISIFNFESESDLLEDIKST
jgi:predicted HTH domain antitoxin